IVEGISRILDKGQTLEFPKFKGHNHPFPKNLNPPLPSATAAVTPVQVAVALARRRALLPYLRAAAPVAVVAGHSCGHCIAVGPGRWRPTSPLQALPPVRGLGCSRPPSQEVWPWSVTPASGLAMVDYPFSLLSSL
ncbi:hypothetical protein B296_00034260, partial [Ensete ventricosum]